jgi:hypothetical protein
MYMLFNEAPESPLDLPFSIHVESENAHALCVFSTAESAASARDLKVPEFYLEAVTPDDVLSLAALFGVGAVAIDPYYREPLALARAEEAVEVLSDLIGKES